MNYKVINTFFLNCYDLEIWFNLFDHLCLEEKRFEFIKRLYSFNFSENRSKIHWDFHCDVRLVEFRIEENKWTFTGSVFNEAQINIQKLKTTTKFEEMCEIARLAHLNYAISKINQITLLIHDCVYTKDARLIRFEFIENLNNMMDRQSEQFHEIEKSYGKDNIGDEYIYSMIKPLRDLLVNVIIKENCPFIEVNAKLKSIRLLMRLEWYMKSGNIRSTSNYKIFIDLLMNSKVLGENEIEVWEKIEN